MTWSTLSYSTVHLESIDFPLFQRFSRRVSTTLSSPLSCLHRPSCINFTQVVNRELCRRGKSSKRWFMLVYSKKDTSEADVSCLCEGGKIKMFFNLKLLNWKVKLRVGNSLVYSRKRIHAHIALSFEFQIDSCWQTSQDVVKYDFCAPKLNVLDVESKKWRIGGLAAVTPKLQLQQIPETTSEVSDQKIAVLGS